MVRNKITIMFGWCSHCFPYFRHLIILFLYSSSSKRVKQRERREIKKYFALHLNQITFFNVHTATWHVNNKQGSMEIQKDTQNKEISVALFASQSIRNIICNRHLSRHLSKITYAMIISTVQGAWKWKHFHADCPKIKCKLPNWNMVEKILKL